MELLPRDQIAFQRMLDVIRRNFERYGFLPVETPVFELSDVLLTKTGGETERQVYFVQSTGSLEQGGQPDLALRFDLTVPLARYVAEHEHELAFPFRRYQMQRVYRGERAQRGRFREFYQCDIDVIAEGVETRQQAQFLMAHGCHEAQGFYYGGAMPAEACSEFFGASPMQQSVS
jgi:histidyl-tRNA synthetase